MKKITALLLALVLCFTLCACSAEKDKNEAADKSTTLSDIGSQETTQAETTEPLTTEPLTTEEETSAFPEEEGTLPEVPVVDLPISEKESISPILYKVSDAKGNVIWLFGSIHVGKEEFYPLPDYVMNAYNSSDVLAVEANVLSAEEDVTGLMNAMRPLLYTDGTTIKDHVSEEAYTAGVNALTELGIYNKALDFYCPAMWSNLIDSVIILNLGIDATSGIDMHFLALATEENKEIYEIESAEFQYGMLGGFSDELQEMLLVSSAEGAADIDAYGEGLNGLIDLWTAGDEEAFCEYLSSDGEGMPAELYEEYYTAMYSDRNNNMTDYAVDALASGEEVFICVGAAHVVGEGSISDNLRELGYTVEMVR